MTPYHCDPCAKDFLLFGSFKKKNRSALKRRILQGGGFLLLLLAFFGIAFIFQEESYSRGQVHWHANLKITVCGKEVPLPKPTAGGNIVHGEAFVGIPFMHLHHEPKIHIEGTVKEAEDITLGKFMGVIGMKFTDTELLDKKNGDLCGEKEGKVKLMVDGRESLELEKRVIKDGERYEILFE